MSERLGALMPVRWEPARESRFRVQLTESGRSMRWLPTVASEDRDPLANLPSLAAVARPAGPGPLTDVLAVSAGPADSAIPLVTSRPEGNGRVVVVEGAGMWRWGFLPPEHQQHDQIYATLWRSLLRWLVGNVGLLPSQQLAIQPDAVTFRTTQTATATLLVREDVLAENLQLELTGDELDEPRRVQPVPLDDGQGVYRAAFGQLPEGRYRVRVKGEGLDDATAVTMFDVIGNLRERLDVAARVARMRDLAERSGGGELTTDDPDEVARRLQEHLTRSRPERLLRTSMWDRWWILLACFALWASTWALRRWSGLI
jgi:hypothetical protein